MGGSNDIHIWHLVTYWWCGEVVKHDGIHALNYYY